jgi:hypothetical protein
MAAKKASHKPSTFDRGAADAYALREAKLGNTAVLAGYLRSPFPLTAEQREFLAELLERFEGKRGKDELRRIERELIRQQVEGLMKEEGLKKEAAIAEVMQWRGISRSKIYAALGESKTRR